MFNSSALYVEQLHLSNFALLLVVILLLVLIALLLLGIPKAIRSVKN